MRTQFEVLKLFFELHQSDPNRFFKVSELKTDINLKALDRCVNSLFSADFLVLDLPTCIKNLTTGKRLRRAYKINPERLEEIEPILNNSNKY
jgi:hypothetical protein